MHGGAPSALFAHVCEQHDPGPAAFVARITVELMRPVPLVPLEMRVRTIRPGRKVQWIEAVLLDDDEREVARATVLRLRSDDVDTSGSVRSAGRRAAAAPSGGRRQQFLVRRTTSGYWNVHDVRIVEGNWTEAGPGIAWFRLRCPVVAGEPISPCSRVAAAADFGSGVGNPVRFTHAIGINADVTITCTATRWASGSASSRARGRNPHGVGLAETRLHDEQGVDRPRACRRCSSNPIGRAADPGASRREAPRRSRASYQSSSDLRSTSVAHQLELAVAEHEHRRAGPRAAGADRRGSCRPGPRSCAGPTAVSIVTRSEVSHLNADGGSVERLERRELLLLAGPALQRLLDPVGDRRHEAVGQLGLLDLVLHDARAAARPRRRWPGARRPAPRCSRG